MTFTVTLSSGLMANQPRPIKSIFLLALLPFLFPLPDLLKQPLNYLPALILFSLELAIDIICLFGSAKSQANQRKVTVIIGCHLSPQLSQGNIFLKKQGQFLDGKFTNGFVKLQNRVHQA